LISWLAGSAALLTITAVGFGLDCAAAAVVSLWADAWDIEPNPAARKTNATGQRRCICQGYKPAPPSSIRHAPDSRTPSETNFSARKIAWQQLRAKPDICFLTKFREQDRKYFTGFAAAPAYRSAMDEPLLPHLEIGAAREEAEMSVILMHGLGADAYDFEDVAEALSLAGEPRKWRFVLPNAPTQAVTINMGMQMPAWYDILDMSQPRAVNWDTVTRSVRSVEALLGNEKAEKIVLAGFSQGAAMALHVGLRHQQSIAGILMMSGYLLENDEHPSPAKTTDLPIGIFHGSDDQVVPAHAAQSAAQSLEAKGFSPSLKIYPGLEHSVFEDEIRDVFEWLKLCADAV
jgi:phospholipase/carboxylesterase